MPKTIVACKFCHVNFEVEKYDPEFVCDKVDCTSKKEEYDRNVVALKSKLPGRSEIMEAIKTGGRKPEITEPAKQSPQPKASKKEVEEAKRKQKLMPQVTVDDDGATDTLRDTKWVYDNIGRLFRRNDIGLEELNENVLEEAPSNGAVGLAHYCLNERKAFFEKFVIKILPKDGPDDREKNEEELMEELDPDFSRLEKYLASNA